MKDIVQTTLDDLVLDFVVYDRHGVSTLRPGDMESMIEEGTLTIDELVDRFRSQLIELLT